jgi:hypothetical protein
LDDFYLGFAILLTKLLLELGDLMKMFNDGNFFSIQALSNAPKAPSDKKNIFNSKEFLEDTQLRKALEGILVYVHVFSFFISSCFVVLMEEFST